jgi:hypothetical protein
MKLHYIVVYYLPRLDVVEKKIKKFSKKSKAFIETCLGPPMIFFRENFSRGPLCLYFRSSIENLLLRAR